MPGRSPLHIGCESGEKVAQEVAAVAVASTARSSIIRAADSWKSVGTCLPLNTGRRLGTFG